MNSKESIYITIRNVIKINNETRGRKYVYLPGGFDSKRVLLIWDRAENRIILYPLERFSAQLSQRLFSRKTE